MGGCFLEWVRRRVRGRPRRAWMRLGMRDVGDGIGVAALMGRRRRWIASVSGR